MPGVLESIRVGDREEDKVELVQQLRNHSLLAVTSDEGPCQIVDGAGRYPLASM